MEDIKDLTEQKRCVDQLRANAYQLKDKSELLIFILSKDGLLNSYVNGLPFDKYLSKLEELIAESLAIVDEMVKDAHSCDEKQLGTCDAYGVIHVLKEIYTVLNRIKGPIRWSNHNELWRPLKQFLPDDMHSLVREAILHKNLVNKLIAELRACEKK
jgi:hypothetical protein